MPSSASPATATPSCARGPWRSTPSAGRAWPSPLAPCVASWARSPSTTAASRCSCFRTASWRTTARTCARSRPRHGWRTHPSTSSTCAASSPRRPSSRRRWSGVPLPDPHDHSRWVSRTRCCPPRARDPRRRHRRSHHPQQNDLAGGLERIADESSVYYLLGFYPPAGKAAQDWRKLRVKVNRHGLTVRARRGYTLRSEPDRWIVPRRRRAAARGGSDRRPRPRFRAGCHRHPAARHGLRARAAAEGHDPRGRRHGARRDRLAYRTRAQAHGPGGGERAPLRGATTAAASVTTTSST